MKQSFKQFLMEETDDKQEIEKKIRSAFMKNKMSVLGLKDFHVDDDFIQFTIKGLKHYRVGTQEELQFVVKSTYNPDDDMIDGVVYAQENHVSRKLDQVKHLEDDYTLNEFAEEINKFISKLTQSDKDKYSKGLSDYMSKGGRGMMPGSVKKDWK